VTTDDFRQRLLDALEDSIAVDGYPKTTVADIVRRARTSRRTFYEHFDTKEACFVALLTEANAEQVRQIAEAVDPDAAWRDQVRQAVQGWIASGEARSSLMLSWIRDVPSLGEEARRLQREVTENFTTMIQALAESDQLRTAGVGPVSRVRIIMLLGGLRELMAITLEEGGRLRDIADEAVGAAIALVTPAGPTT
jgi:AcrR family transcriptional regulator